MKRSSAVLLFFLVALLGPAGHADTPVPVALQSVGVEEHLGQVVPLDLELVDARGERRRLGDFFGKSNRPIVLDLVWYRCPMLCNLVQQGLAKALRSSGWVLGKNVDAISVSMDPREGPADSARKQRGHLQALGLGPDSGGWSFLTGGQREIDALSRALGFRYKYDAKNDQFAHSAVLFVLTSSGKISRYLYGVEFSPRDLRLALTEAGEGRAGSSFDRVLLQCYRYDPATRRYGFFVFGFLRTGGGLIFIALAALLLRFWRQDLLKRGHA